MLVLFDIGKMRAIECNEQMNEWQSTNIYIYIYTNM